MLSVVVMVAVAVELYLKKVISVNIIEKSYEKLPSGSVKNSALPRLPAH